MNENFVRVYVNAEHTNCYTYFSIVGKFNPNQITEILQLQPDKISRIGDKNTFGTYTYEEASWKFGKCEEYDGLVANQMLKTITPLLSKKEELKKIEKEFEVEFYLEVVPTVRYDESSPVLAPSMEVIKFCYETNTQIDIDLYVSCPDDMKEEKNVITQ